MASIDAGRLTLTAVLFALLGVAEAYVVGRFGFGFFRLVALAYVTLFVVLPILAAILLVVHRLPAAPKRLTRPALALAVPCLLLPPLGWHASFVAPYQLVVERTEVDVVAELETPIKIAVLADFQSPSIGDYQRGAIDRLLALEPDLILIPGDVIQAESHADYLAVLPDFHVQLRRLRAPGGAYFAQGNTDPYPMLGPLIGGTGVVNLDDSIVRVEVRGVTLAIGGLRLLGHNYPSGQIVLDTLETEHADADVRLLVSHLPDAALSLPTDSMIDLVVSGHTHGGQVQLPGFGPLVTLSAVPRAIGGGGLGELRGNAIYVSRGVGIERAPAPPVRFFCPPELSLLTLR
ncbi:MAG: metallophosphoesterase [Planctomycetota bacterium]|nr:metallophosphoesterase [Planctomycetota bacterium]